MTIRWRVVGPIALLLSATVWWVGSTASTKSSEPSCSMSRTGPAQVAGTCGA